MIHLTAMDIIKIFSRSKGNNQDNAPPHLPQTRKIRCTNTAVIHKTMNKTALQFNRPSQNTMNTTQSPYCAETLYVQDRYRSLEPSNGWEQGGITHQRIGTMSIQNVTRIRCTATYSMSLSKRSQPSPCKVRLMS